MGNGEDSQSNFQNENTDLGESYQPPHQRLQELKPNRHITGPGETSLDPYSEEDLNGEQNLLSEEDASGEQSARSTTLANH